MAYETYLGPSCNRFVSYSEEHCMLLQLCYRLAATCHAADESPDVDETRKQAKLLMNLMHCHSAAGNKSTDVVVEMDRSGSSLERSTSDESFASFHSTRTRSTQKQKRDRFSFTCPSLSLENSDVHSYFHDVEREVSGMQSQFAESDTGSLPPPAHLLLGRSLKVDDPDALRLSADAMARNVLQSFQKAMHWRIQAWIYVLSKKIVECEHQMLAAGASVEDLKTLLHTPEAMLIVALQKLAQDRGVAAESVITSFEVLSQRIEDFEEDAQRCSRVTVTPTRSSSSGSSSSSSSGSQSSDEVTSLSDHSTDTMCSHSLEAYSYVVAHELRFSCTVHLQTLVGFTEIAISVPGTVAGAFESSELDPSAQFKSVKVNLDTTALATLIDKACRAVVRSSVEKVISQPLETTSPQASFVDENKVDVTHDAGMTMTPDVSPYTLTSPPAPAPAVSTDNVDVAHDATICAFVTPGPQHSDVVYHTTTPTNILIPIPDDLQGCTKSNDTPRRISPQPTTSSSSNSSTGSGSCSRRRYLRTGSANSDDSLSVLNVPLVSTRATSLKRRTPPPPSMEEAVAIDVANETAPLNRTTAKARHTSVQFLRQRRSLPLISPPGGSRSQTNTIQFYHNVPGNGPSLPMLVEAACQVASRCTTNGRSVKDDAIP